MNNNHIESFKKLLGYGTYRPYKGKTEVRVKNLDTGLASARKIIEEHNLKLEISSIDPVLKSFTIG